MAKTYEANWHNPKTGIDIIVARGSSEEHVRAVAQRAQFVPFTIREYQTEDNIREMYRAWRKENGNQKPNRVIVKMHWKDGDNTEKGYQVDTISLKEYKGDAYPTDDCWLLYYVSGLKGLLELMKPKNGSDFVVDEVLEFYKK